MATVKHDPSDMSDGALSPIADEDQYEDTGELEMPKQMPKGWMIQVPKEIYTDWSQIAAEQSVQLGVVRRFKTGPRAGKVIASIKGHQTLHSS